MEDKIRDLQEYGVFIEHHNNYTPSGLYRGVLTECQFHLLKDHLVHKDPFMQTEKGEIPIVIGNIQAVISYFNNRLENEMALESHEPTFLPGE